MKLYTGILPEGFEWQYQSEQDDRLASATLLFNDQELATVKPMGLAWVVVLRPAYAQGEHALCVVASRHRGQAWIVKWLRQRLMVVRKTGAQRACSTAAPASIDRAVQGTRGEPRPK